MKLTIQQTIFKNSQFWALSHSQIFFFVLFKDVCVSNIERRRASFSSIFLCCFFSDARIQKMFVCRSCVKSKTSLALIQFFVQ